MKSLFNRFRGKPVITPPVLQDTSAPLSEDDYEKLHDILLTSTLKDGYTNLLSQGKKTSNLSAGVNLPTSLQRQLHDHFNINQLYQNGILSESGNEIELSAVIRQLPDRIVQRYYNPPSPSRNNENDLKQVFKGTTGVAGKPGFGILLNSSIKDNLHKYADIISLNPKDLLTPDHSNASVVIITNPDTIRKLAPILNFQGASHYTAKTIGH